MHYQWRVATSTTPHHSTHARAAPRPHWSSTWFSNSQFFTETYELSAVSWNMQNHLTNAAELVICSTPADADQWHQTTCLGQYQYQYQSQIHLARANFVIKNAIGGATWEWGANCPCDDGSSMSSSETWNTEVCCTVSVVTHVVIHSRFVVQPQKSDGDQMKCQCEEPLAGP